MARKSFSNDKQFDAQFVADHATSLTSRLSEINLLGNSASASPVAANVGTPTKPKDPLAVKMKPQKKTVAWYKEDLGTIPQSFLDLFPLDGDTDALVAHIYAIVCPS